MGCKLIDVQKPDYFRAGFTPPESYDVTSNALVKKSALVFIGLIQNEIRPGNDTNESHRWQNARNELATCDRES